MKLRPAKPATPEYPVPASLIDSVGLGGVPPADLDPLADGILMLHQKRWLEDRSDFKAASKGRRTGITFAEALDSTLSAAAARSAGGDNTWYVGDTKEKGREFINTCATFAKSVAAELLTVEEFLFDDVKPDGSSRQITAFRIRFASGFQIAALSSRPANIRGLQGRVIIDEAAFHPDVRGVIDACTALIIWGGKIRIISTHNGAGNPFNDLIKEIRAGKFGPEAKVHHITFDDAVANGLYERVCLVRGWTPSPEGKAAWYAKVRGLYGTNTEAMREELDAIPREGDGTMLPLAWIEACMTPAYKVVRWSPPAEDFVDWPEHLRREAMADWLRTHVDPVLATLDARHRHSLGEDFAMRKDRTAIVVGYVDQGLRRHVPLIVELRTCPYDQQKQTLFHIGRQVPRFNALVADANGNGMVLAQEARQEFGKSRVLELMADDAWHRENTARLATAFEERTILLPADADVRDDLKQFRIINGVGKIPRAVRIEGTDGGKRHADTAVAIDNFYAATLLDTPDLDEAEIAGDRRAGAALDGVSIAQPLGLTAAQPVMFDETDGVDRLDFRGYD